MYAAAYINKDIVEYLLGKDETQVHTVDNMKKTVLHHAMKRVKARKTVTYDQAQADIVKMLINSGVEIDARDQNGCTALMFAIANGETLVVRDLLMAKADVNATEFDGRGPLDFAQRFEQHHIAELLRQCGAVSNKMKRDRDEDETSVHAGYVAEMDGVQPRDAGGALDAAAGYKSSSQSRRMPAPPAEKDDD